MSDDPCQDQRENYDKEIAQAIVAVAAAAAAAPETLGLSLLVGALLGGYSGYAIATAHNQLARCLRDHGLSAEADVLDDVGSRFENELALLESQANAAMA
ncbi:MAG TPA: hypothetical protein VGR06_32575 [Actinophytocola sp.]|jgi:hypothetical protein|uniref:hypothetical protein n=1 Tax=Actinophytocola sp. TaxID=1872138 RepID=UPI002E031B31|nr:hypothetical protein [Actinophytocola sp.]